ncbi:MAG: Gfo/Idh/MocA family protein [Phocaeicola sp.]|uniref:Gfo/Idh/MocA family protein n=1 Tax=Phocaeicola sp. TaxID=2773926 RepID=UPI003FA0CB2C
MENRKIRMGMIGGGSDAFIGAIHCRAALMENQIELVCGCFSINPDISISSGRSYFIPDNRIYLTWQEMIEKESQLPKEQRIDFVTIVTPNKFHCEPALAALDAGFNVVIDKPMTYSLEEALQLREKVKETGLTLALTHVYSAYPAVKEMKKRIANGVIGKVRRLFVEYSQGWLTKRIELKGGNNAVWRNDPKAAGKGGCVGDIGTHAWHLAEYVTGAKVTEVCAELRHIADGRPLDDDAVAFMHFDQGFPGLLQVTQVATGEANNIRLRVYGETAGMEWRQMEPNILYMKWLDRPTEEVRVGNRYVYLSDFTKWNTRTPGGHPEGFIEAFANIYQNFALTIRAKANGEAPTEEMLDFPTVEDGVRGMQFIETMVRAGHNNDEKWQKWVEK